MSNVGKCSGFFWWVGLILLLESQLSSPDKAKEKLCPYGISIVPFPIMLVSSIMHISTNNKHCTCELEQQGLL